MKKPDWLPEPPEGWGAWFTLGGGVWKCIDATHARDVFVSLEGHGACASAQVKSVDGGKALFRGATLANLHRACAAVGLTEWLPEPWEARLQRAMASFRDELKSLSGPELLARMEESYTGEFDALFEEHGSTVPDAPGLWLYTDGLGDNCARVCLDGDALVAQVPGVAGAVPLGELDVDWLGPVGRGW